MPPLQCTTADISTQFLFILKHCVFGEGNGTPLQYSCLENPMNGGAWKAAVHGVAEGRTWLSDFTFTFHFPALASGFFTTGATWEAPLLLLLSAAKSLQSCPTLCDHRRQPTRLPRPSDSPGKSTGVGCHFLLQCIKVKSESKVVQSCPTVTPMDYNPPLSYVHGILQARILEWVAISNSRRSSWPRDQTRVSCVYCVGRQVLYHWVTWEAHP